MDGDSPSIYNIGVPAEMPSSAALTEYKATIWSRWEYKDKYKYKQEDKYKYK